MPESEGGRAWLGRCAVLVIAVFYTDALSWAALGVAAALLAALAVFESGVQCCG